MSMTEAAAPFGLVGMAFGAAADLRAGRRASNIALWQAMQTIDAAWGEAKDTSEALIRQNDTAARVFDLQETISDFDAGLAQKRGTVEENRTRDQTDRTIAGQQAYWAGSNIDAASGSPLMMAAMSAAQGEMDAQIVRADTAARVAGFRFQSQSIAMQKSDNADATAFGIEAAYKTAGSQATGALMQGVLGSQAARKQAAYGVAAGLLSGASKIAGFYMNPVGGR